MAITVKINNSYSQVCNLDVATMKELRTALSYLDDPQAAYFAGGYQRRRYLIDKKGFFPTGLLNTALNVLNNTRKPNTRIEIIDERKFLDYQPTNQPIKGLVPYQSQIDAVESALVHRRGTIAVPTGGGKSVIITLLAKYTGLKTLVIVPNLELKRQLTETIQSYLGRSAKVVIENIDSPNLQRHNDFECLIIDECHHSAAKTYQQLNKKYWNHIAYRWFFTATPFRNQDHEKLLYEGIAGEVIYRLTYRDAVKQGYIVPVEAYYCDLPKQPVEGYTWNQVYNEIVIDNDYRNSMITNLLQGLSDKFVLILVKEIRHGKLLSKITGIPFTSGQDDGSKQYIQDFNSGQIKHLIGTTGVIGEGVDTKPAEYVMIAGLGKAKSAFMQQVGRAVRRYGNKESAKIIIFKDPSHKFTMSHFNAQRKILLDEYGAKVLKL